MPPVLPLWAHCVNNSKIYLDEELDPNTTGAYTNSEFGGFEGPTKSGPGRAWPPRGQILNAARDVLEEYVRGGA